MPLFLASAHVITAANRVVLDVMMWRAADVVACLSLYAATLIAFTRN